MTSANCIFCKVASGEIPSFGVLDEADAVAFLDIGPLTPGHTLLVPRAHYESLLDVPPEVVSSLAGYLPKLGRAIVEATGATGLNLLQNTGDSSGQAVFHLHFHLIPRQAGDGLGYRWNTTQYDRGKAESLQSSIQEALRRV
jgi:histidine triad (HIT) family protein